MTAYLHLFTVVEVAVYPQHRQPILPSSLVRGIPHHQWSHRLPPHTMTESPHILHLLQLPRLNLQEIESRPLFPTAPELN